MIFCERPSRTPKVPMIEVTMQTAQMTSGSSIMFRALAPKKMDASTMVATVVTAAAAQPCLFGSYATLMKTPRQVSAQSDVNGRLRG